MRRHPTRQFVDFAHAVVDLGVDVFHGHSAHIFQGIEVHRGKPIMYDTGDFIDDYYVGPERNDQTFLFLVKAGRNGVVEIELVPALISRCQVNLARGRDAEDICRKMEVLSREMGTEVETEKNGGYHCLIKL
jgi:poly-gamma-glutamate synthesis protein (capsule biosynthesis protein)